MTTAPFAPVSAPRARSFWLALAALASLWLPGRLALADESGGRLVYVLGEGSDAPRGLDAVRAALPGAASVADDAATQEIFESAKIKLPLGARAATPQARKALAAKLQRALDKHPGSVVVVVLSPASRTARRGMVEVLVVGSGKTAVLADRAVDTSRKDDKLRDLLAKALAGVAEPAKEGGPADPPAGTPPPSGDAPPPASSPPDAAGAAGAAADTPPPEKAAEPGAAPGTSGVREGFLVAELAIGTIGRHFSLKDRLTSNLRAYDLLAAPRAAASLELYPLASTGVPVLRGLGLFGSYELAFGLSSKLPEGEALTTKYSRYQAGLRLRVPVGERALVGIEGAYKGENFTFSTPADPAAPLGPSVQYRTLRGGLFGRIPAGPVAVLVSAGYDGVLQTGPLGELFPHAKAAGVSGDLGAALPVSRLVELRLSLRYERFFYALHPLPGETFVAGGALDQFFGLQFGAALAP